MKFKLKLWKHVRLRLEENAVRFSLSHCLRPKQDNRRLKCKRIIFSMMMRLLIFTNCWSKILLIWRNVSRNQIEKEKENLLFKNLHKFCKIFQCSRKMSCQCIGLQVLHMAVKICHLNNLRQSYKIGTRIDQCGRKSW